MCLVTDDAKKTVAHFSTWRMTASPESTHWLFKMHEGIWGKKSVWQKGDILFHTEMLEAWVFVPCLFCPE